MTPTEQPVQAAIAFEGTDPAVLGPAHSRALFESPCIGGGQRDRLDVELGAQFSGDAIRLLDMLLQVAAVFAGNSVTHLSDVIDRRRLIWVGLFVTHLRSPGSSDPVRIVTHSLKKLVSR